MQIQRVDYSRYYRFIASIWDSSLLGKGTLSRFLTKVLIPKPHKKVIAKTLYGFELLVDASIDKGVERSLYYFGTYEKGTLQFIQQHLKPGQTFFDIGANIGLMSIFAASCVGPQGRVLAFEANPETVPLLKYNIELNNIHTIRIVDKAVGNQNGKLTLYNKWDVNRGGASLIRPEKDSGSFEVEIIKIDTDAGLAAMDIHLVKVDVEGFELDVLRGMEGVLRRSKPPVLIIECSTDRHNNYESVHEIYHFIKSCNAYKIYKLDKTKERLGNLTEITNKEQLPGHDNIFCICS